VRAGLKEVIKRLEPNLNRQAIVINEVSCHINYLLVCNNVMHLQLLILTLWIIVNQIICE